MEPRLGAATSDVENFSVEAPLVSMLFEYRSLRVAPLRPESLERQPRQEDDAHRGPAVVFVVVERVPVTRRSPTGPELSRTGCPYRERNFARSGRSNLVVESLRRSAIGHFRFHIPCIRGSRLTQDSSKQLRHRVIIDRRSPTLQSFRESSTNSAASHLSRKLQSDERARDNLPRGFDVSKIFSAHGREKIG